MNKGHLKPYFLKSQLHKVVLSLDEAIYGEEQDHLDEAEVAFERAFYQILETYLIKDLSYKFEQSLKSALDSLDEQKNIGAASRELLKPEILRNLEPKPHLSSKERPSI
jgi:hypothetical protein